jgi:XTP/dITP diphosphohydrolase
MPILLATTNPAKLREIRRILADLPHAFTSLADQPPLAAPDETGSSFEAIAREKALYYAAATGLPTVAEDSGLEVAALDGAPGVRSSRYDGATYPEKFAHLYAELRARGRRTSPARFVCAVAFARGRDVLFEARGVVEGEIAPAPRGSFGFGYDPIFYYPPYGRTLGELTDEQKAAISHRGQAFRALRAFLAGRDPGEFD